MQQNGRLFVNLRPLSSTAQQPTLQHGSRLNGENRSTAQQEQTNPQQKPTPSSESNQEPIEIVVTGKPDTGYNVPDASVGTRTNTPTRDVPQVINVIPQQVIKDQHTLYIGDALRNAGVSNGALPTILSDRFTIRGFNTGNILTDGLRNYFLGSIQALNTNNIERIEVLRGPASVLYGRGDLSGTINLVTKQPLKDPYYTASFSVGSYNTYQPSFDFSGPVTSDKKVLYRLDGSYLTNDNFVDFYHQNRYQLGGALAWEIGKDTKLTLNSSYEGENSSFYWQGLPAVGTLLPNPNGKIPRNRSFGEPGIENPEDTTLRLSYKLEHRFNENWSVENAFQATFFRPNYDYRFFPTGLQADNRTLNRTVFTYPNVGLYNVYDVCDSMSHAMS